MTGGKWYHSVMHVRLDGCAGDKWEGREAGQETDGEGVLFAG
jgi:hypothetical protein